MRIVKKYGRREHQKVYMGSVAFPMAIKDATVHGIKKIVHGGWDTVVGYVYHQGNVCQVERSMMHNTWYHIRGEHYGR